MKQNTVLTEDSLVRVTFDDGLYASAYDPFVVSKGGQKLDLTKDKIKLLPEKQLINFSRIAPALQQHFRAWLSVACAKYSNTYIFNNLNLFTDIEVPVNLSSEDEIREAIEVYFKKFMESDKSASSKSMMRSMYAWFVEESFPYFDEDFYDFYLSVKKFGTDEGKGLDVIMELPNRGPLTFKEQRVFNECIANLSVENMSTMELQGFFALKAGQVLGIRDIQVINLRFSDLIESDNGVFALNVTRAKQRGHFRNGTPKKTRPITKSLVRVIDALKERYQIYGKTPVDDSWHVVCDFTMGRNARPTGQRVAVETFKNRRLIIQEYLELPFKVTNRRLRKTFCTKLIAKGTPLKVVAELMDHSDLQQLEVYYRQTHHVASKLDKVLRDEAREILDAFNGKIIHHGDESQSGQQIFAPTGDIELHLIGSCGSGKPCSLNPPLSCYGCASLEAFEDADHKSVVDHMVSEVKSVFGEKHAIEILQHKNFLAATQLVNKLEEGSL